MSKPLKFYGKKEREEGGLRGRLRKHFQDGRHLYVYGLKQRAGAKRDTHESLNIGELFPLLLLFIDRSIFSNCFLLDTSNSRRAKKLTVPTGGRPGGRGRHQSSNLHHYPIYNRQIFLPIR